jgi:phosphoribosylformylglycinamidine synthase
MERQLAILTGEGIECEKETKRFFETLKTFSNIKYLSVQETLNNPSVLNEYKKGDCLFIPGGFSYADHFGAGKLLAYTLHRSNFFDKIQNKGMHVFAVCNGFQVLTAAGIFGNNVSLEPNKLHDKRLGFCNRWIQTQSCGALEENFFQLPVRHGEGRLVIKENSTLSSNVEAFLLYQDNHFDNGSDHNIAGLVANHGSSYFWAMMPHPEIALFPLTHPDVVGPEYFPKLRHTLKEAQGDGVKLFEKIFTFLTSKGC